jgi:selenocysteine lyase/cysteine desulfurase
VFDARGYELAPAARRLEYATISYGAAIGVGACIDYALDLGIDRIAAHVRGLTDRLLEGLDRLGADVVTPHDARAGVINARFPGHETSDLVAGLVAAEVHVAPRLGGIRFSPHHYNQASDIDRALEVLEGLL